MWAVFTDANVKVPPVMAPALEIPSTKTSKIRYPPLGVMVYVWLLLPHNVVAPTLLMLPHYVVGQTKLIPLPQTLVLK